MRKSGGLSNGGSVSGVKGERQTTAEFFRLLRRGQVKDPANGVLVAGQVTTVPRLAGATATMMRALTAEFTALLPGAKAALELWVRPLLELGPTDLWRPELALLRGTAAKASPSHTPAERGPREAWRYLLPHPLVQAELVVELNGGPAGFAERLVAYARAAVPEVWHIDEEAGWTVTFRAPWGGAYASRLIWYPGEGVPCRSLNGAAVPTLH